MTLRAIAGLLKRASVASLAFYAVQAGAVTYVGSWDPAIGTPFSQWSWSGTVTWDITEITPSGCQPASNGVVYASLSCSLSLTSGKVKIYETLDDSNSIELDFPLANSELTEVHFGSDSSGKGLVGKFDPFLPSSIFGDDPRQISGTEWNLSFDLLPVLNWQYKALVCEEDDDKCKRQKCEEDDDKCKRDKFLAVLSSYEDCKETYIPGSTAKNGDSAPVTWRFFGPTPVPEPSSLALLLSALGAFAFVRRRKDQATAAPLT